MNFDQRKCANVNLWIGLLKIKFFFSLIYLAYLLIKLIRQARIKCFQLHYLEIIATACFAIETTDISSISLQRSKVFSTFCVPTINTKTMKKNYKKIQNKQQQLNLLNIN